MNLSSEIDSCKPISNIINSINNFNELLYNHIANIFRDVSYLPDSFFDLLIEYSKSSRSINADTPITICCRNRETSENEKYSSFNEDNIQSTIEEIYIDYIKYLINENSQSLNKYFNSINTFITNFPEDISSFHSLPILIMMFDDENITNINLITEFIQNIIKKNPNLIVEYLKNNIDKYLY